MVRRVDAWCTVCNEVRSFTMQDPGSCKCTKCGHVEQMFAPLEPTHRPA